MMALTGTEGALKATMKADIITALTSAGFNVTHPDNPNADIVIAALAEGIANAIIPHLTANVQVDAGQTTTAAGATTVGPPGGPLPIVALPGSVVTPGTIS